MLFNSLHFLIFFPIVVMLYFGMPARWRWGLLLVASYYFYGCWRVEYLSLIVLSTIIDYVAGIQIDKAETKARKKLFLSFSLLTNLGLLFTFKYFNFFTDSVESVFSTFNILYHMPELRVLLPVGISFYTFQTLSYTIDVYKGRRSAERHFGIFAVYVSFFPQLVAGPIERSTNLLPQFHEKHSFSKERLYSGIRLMLWGFFKKVVVADRLAYYVDQVYNAPTTHSTSSLVIATYLFAYQIYCDFSGYSDIAIGSARVMGYDLMTNFKQPYFSRSIREFWKRWHISLSSWFQDYVYIGLGGNRVGKFRWYSNLMITFMVSGLWHGANWTFVVWGFLHGFYLIFSIWTTTIRKTIADALRLSSVHWLDQVWKVFVTFHLALLAWVFFRANNLNEAFYILQHGFAGMVTGGDVFSLQEPFTHIREVWYILLLLVVMNAYDWARWREFSFLNKPLVIYLDMTVQFWFIVVFGMFNKTQFIYFQF